VVFIHTLKFAPFRVLLQLAKAEHAPLVVLKTANLHLASLKHAAWQADGVIPTPRLPHFVPSILNGLPEQRRPSGTESAGIILGGSGIGEGATVVASTGTFCHTSKPSWSKRTSQEAKAEQAPLSGLKVVKLQSPSDRQAAPQDSREIPIPKLAQVFPRRLMGEPEHRWPSGTCDARTIE